MATEKVYTYIGEEDDACELAMKAALDVIATTCAKAGITPRPWPVLTGEEECEFVLLNSAMLIEEAIFGPHRSDNRAKIGFERADTSVFDIVRTPTPSGYKCEGHVRFVNIALQILMDVPGIRKSWGDFENSMSNEVARRSFLQTHIYPTLREYTALPGGQLQTSKAIITDIKVWGAIATVHKLEEVQRVDVDITLEVTFAQDPATLPEKTQVEFFPSEPHRFEIVHGKHGASAKQIIIELHDAYKKGITDYVMVANDGTHVIFNVDAVMEEPRPPTFDKDLETYISNLLIRPKEGGL